MPYKEFDVDGVFKVKIYKRRANRSLRLTVAADGAVRLTMPLWAPYQAGLAFARSKRDWILAHGSPQTDLLTDGAKIGKSHHLVFRQSTLPGEIKSNVRSTEIIVTHGPDLDTSNERVQKSAQAASWRALKQQAQALLSQRLNQLAAKHGVDYGSLNIKRMKSRWGSCDHHKNIVLNLYLIQLPWELIDYVILHELTHTKVLHHGADFWREFESMQPNARQFRRAIKAYRPTLLAG